MMIRETRDRLVLSTNPLVRDRAMYLHTPPKLRRGPNPPTVETSFTMATLEVARHRLAFGCSGDRAAYTLRFQTGSDKVRNRAKRVMPEFYPGETHATEQKTDTCENPSVVLLTGEHDSGSSRWRRARGFCFWFGACSTIEVICYGRSFEDAAEWAFGYVAEQFPGLVVSDEQMDEYRSDAREELGFPAEGDLTDEQNEQVWELSKQDLMSFDGCVWVPSQEWTGAEINRDEIKSKIQKAREDGSFRRV